MTAVGEDYETEVWTAPRRVPPAPPEDAAVILDSTVRAVEDDAADGREPAAPRPRGDVRCAPQGTTRRPDRPSGGGSAVDLPPAARSLRDFTYTGRTPGGGDASRGGPCWERQEEKLGGRRVVLVDTLIGDSDEDEEATPHARTAPLHFCRGCGAAHPTPVSRCRACGRGGDTVRLRAVRQNPNRPGRLTSCLSCGSTGRTPSAGRYREPARPVRAINVADVHLLAQDMVHHAEPPRLLAFCDNRQDAAFQAGWMRTTRAGSGSAP